MKKLKVAIVADWLTTQGGAEKVLESFHTLYPNAEFFTSVYIPENFPKLQNTKVHTTWLQKLPKFLRKRHQLLYPFLPTAIETLDLSGFDFILSSSTFVAKAVISDEYTKHLCYCHTPTRYFWDEWQYFLKEGINIPKFLRPLKPLFPRMFTQDRIWDFVSAQRPDAYIGNSEYGVRRINKYYNRESDMLRPPVDFKKFSAGLQSEKSDFYISFGRLIPYKKFDLLVQAFKRMPDKKLKIGGRGPELEYLQKLAQNCPNIEFLGFVEDKKLIKMLGQAKAFLFPQNEDAGIAPMEALCSGTPCIAFKKGGALNMVFEQGKKKNGIFFEKQTADDLIEAIKKFENNENQQYFNNHNTRKYISENMQEYSEENFEKNLKKLIDNFLCTHS